MGASSSSRDPNVYNQIEGDEIIDETIAERVGTLGERAVEFAQIEPDPPCLESEQNVWPAE
jgi:hypothetical protein